MADSGKLLMNLSGTQVENWFTGSHSVNLTLLCALANGSVLVPLAADSTGALTIV